MTYEELRADINDRAAHLSDLLLRHHRNDREWQNRIAFAIDHLVVDLECLKRKALLGRVRGCCVPEGVDAPGLVSVMGLNPNRPAPEDMGG